MAGIRHVLPEVDFGTDALPDLEARLAALRAAGQRAVPVRYLGGTAWLLLRHEDVGRAFRDPLHFPAAAANLRYSLPVQGRTLLCTWKVRSIASTARWWPPRSSRRRWPSTPVRLLRPLANELIDGFGARRELDLVEHYCHRYPLRVIAGLLGIPAQNEAQLFGWVRGLFDYPFNPQGRPPGTR